MRKLLAVAALAVGSLGPIGQRSEAVTGWKTIAVGVVQVTLVPTRYLGGVELSAIAHQPEALRIVIESTLPSGDHAGTIGAYNLRCWRFQPFEVVEGGGSFDVPDLPTTIRLTDAFGGVRAWANCLPLVSVSASPNPGTLKVRIQARYP